MPKIKKRSVRIKGHATSVSLEEAFWETLKEIAVSEGKSINQLITDIDANDPEANLSSSIRVFILKRLIENQAAE